MRLFDCVSVVHVACTRGESREMRRLGTIYFSPFYFTTACSVTQSALRRNMSVRGSLIRYASTLKDNIFTLGILFLS